MLEQNSLSRYRSNKSERRRDKQNREEPQISYDDRIGYYWMNLDAIESEEEEENTFFQEDLNLSLNSSVNYGQYYDYAVNESSLGYTSDFSDNEAPDFLKYF